MRQISLLAHFIGIYGLTVRHVHAVVVEHFAACQVTFGDGAYLDDRTTNGRRQLVTEKCNTGNRVRRFEMHQVIWDPERVEWPFTHFVQVQVVALLWIIVLSQTVNLDPRRTDRVIDDASELPQLV